MDCIILETNVILLPFEFYGAVSFSGLKLKVLCSYAPNFSIMLAEDLFIH